MNIINHIDGRELLGYIDITPNDLNNFVTELILGQLKKMQEKGLPIVKFLGGEKTKSSMITKLLCKRESIASQIFDHIRFRIITKTRNDIIPVLCHLKNEFIAANHVIPGESVNNLINFIEVLKKNPKTRKFLKDLQTDIGLEDELRIMDFQEQRKINIFSAPNYRAINFVFDMPIKLTKFSGKYKDYYHESLGNVIFSMVEFQILDQHTDELNQIGEASHGQYKQRQMDRVWARLIQGLNEI